MMLFQTRNPGITLVTRSIVAQKMDRKIVSDPGMNRVREVEGSREIRGAAVQVSRDD